MTARRHDDEAMPLAPRSPRDEDRQAHDAHDARAATDPGPPPGEAARGRVDTLPDGMELADPQHARPAAGARGPRGELVAIPYEPATNNEDYNRLLNMLSPPATAPAIQSSTTDGQLAAQYDAAGVPLARRSVTPLPEPRVLLNCTGDIAARASHASRAPGAVDGRSAPPPEDRTRRTVTIVRTRSILPGVLLGAAVTALLLFLFVCIGVAVRERHRSPAAASPAETASRASLHPSLRATGPDIPPPPPEADVMSSTSSGTGAAEPAPPSTGAAGAGGAGRMVVPAGIATETDVPRSLPLATPPPSRKIEREL